MLQGFIIAGNDLFFRDSVTACRCPLMDPLYVDGRIFSQDEHGHNVIPGLLCTPDQFQIPSCGEDGFKGEILFCGQEHMPDALRFLGGLQITAASLPLDIVCVYI